MRNIRIADPGDRISAKRPPPERRSRLVDWIATLPLIALLPALMLIASVTSGSEASMATSPATTTAGGRVTINGTGFPRAERGYLAWDGSPTTTVYKARGNGRFSVTFTVPAKAAASSHELAAFGGPGTPVERASVSIQVTASAPTSAPTPTPTTAPTPTPTRAPTPTPTTAPTPTPTTAPTSPPTTAPTPSPTTAPTAAPPAPSCGSSLQAMVNAVPSGGTLNVTGCGPYREVVTITRPLTLIGASITGGTAAPQSGNIQISGTSNVVIENARVTDSGGACISADNSSYVTIRGSFMSGCAQEGYHISHVDHLLFTGNRITGNNPRHEYSWGWEAGGGKACFTTNSTFSNNEADHNLGPGLWFDCNDSGITISGNRVHDNALNGIHWETGLSGSIVNNVVWNNDRTIASEYGWGWGAGILLSSSANTEVSGNIVAWNGDGIVVLSQNRSDQPASGIVGNYVHDNDIFGTDAWPDSSQNYGLAWLQDWSGAMFASSSGNHASANAFWYAAPEGAARYAWAGRDYGGLASFAGTAGGSGSSYLSATQASAILDSAGVPLAP
jgi:hypothetical protein